MTLALVGSFSDLLPRCLVSLAFGGASIQAAFFAAICFATFPIVSLCRRSLSLIFSDRFDSLAWD